MSKKSNKPAYLIETSAVLVSLGESTPAHCQHFAGEVRDGDLHTSIYIRMEFIRRWILDYIRMAATVDQVSNLHDTLFDLNQDFGIRSVKTQNHAIALLLKEKGRIENSRIAAIELGRLAFAELKKFDRRFRSEYPENRSGCRVGGKKLKVDFNDLFSDLREFVASMEPIDDCTVNEFLHFGGDGPAHRLLEVHEVHKTKAGKQLAKLLAKGKWITCKECARIGDAIIALEQPPGFCLVHIDKDFKILCSVTGLPHKLILSERAVAKRLKEAT